MSSFWTNSQTTAASAVAQASDSLHVRSIIKQQIAHLVSGLLLPSLSRKGRLAM